MTSSQQRPQTCCNTTNPLLVSLAITFSLSLPLLLIITVIASLPLHGVPALVAIIPVPGRIPSGIISGLSTISTRVAVIPIPVAAVRPAMLSIAGRGLSTALNIVLALFG